MLARQARMLIRPMFNTLRCFASLSNKRLAKALEKEVEYEQEQYKIDDSVGPFLSQSGFELADVENDTQIILKKRTDDAEVEVTFNARAPQEEPEPQEGQEGQEEQEGHPGTYVDFQVMVKKVDTDRGLIFECSSIDSEISVNNVVYSEDLKNTDRESSFISRGIYRGPDFTTLDEKVQNSFVDYLKSFGINDDMAIFIETYSLDKEHRLYMEWLRRVKGFVS
ncbi:unnamed protein product [Blepharisma stoltei]|uniref:Uncharacterized protein n=1 Tax=Blepharisma stoltei TaxID=1481888 RepID=A0AAU9K0X3_9CILI|nr:unnamed protein product [Blepharisma stoltei]